MPGPESRYWGPFAALVWIVTRDDEITRAADDLERINPPPLTSVAALLSIRNRELDMPDWFEDDAGVPLALWRFIDPSMQGPAKDIETAPDRLLQELQDGSCLRATGHKDAGEKRLDIPVHFWRSAGPYLPDPGGDVHIAFADRRTVWTDILLRMHDVKRRWQPLKRGKRMPRRPSEASIAEWYQKRVASWPAGKVPPSFDDDWTDAKHDLDCEPSKEQMEAARRNFAPLHWKKRGRRPRPKTPEA